MPKTCHASQMLLPGVIPANLSPLPGSKEARKMTATSGRRCYDLYKSVVPNLSFVKTLLVTSKWDSTLCSLTWKTKATPAGRLLFQLAAKVFPTKETGCGLSPTAQARDYRSGDKPGSKRALRKEKQGWSKNLNDLAAQGLMPTPNTLDGMPPRSKEAMERQFATARKGRTKPGNLREFIHPGMWPTPTAQDFKRRGPNSRQQGLSNTENFVEAPLSGDLLNPLFVEEMMGYPIGWTGLRD